MTIKEQIYIEDKYRLLAKDESVLIDRMNNFEEVDYIEVYETIEEYKSIRALMRLIENFVEYVGYDLRNCESGWTLFKREEG